MELKVSSPKPAGLSPSDCVSDPEEKEVSDDDDDDRNHKHRRRDTRSQSLERDASEQFLTRPFRKRNKPFENGHLFRESDSQSSEGWKNYNRNPQEKNFSAKFEKRRLGLSAIARGPLDLNQRMRVNQSLSGDPGPGRGRGRESGAWNQRDSRFSSVDITSQMIQQGPVPPSLFAGRGLSNVSNAQSASWGAFGLIAGMPNAGLDTLHPLGLQGTLRTPINPSLNIGIPRQRCRDFEERGFCLRGDMCPMEHGVNRIVVEDVQSLSQFNLPVSLPSAHLLGTPCGPGPGPGPGPLPSVSASSTLMNNKGSNSKNNKPGMADDGLGLNGAFSTGVGGADVYDPDQPLWNNDCPETSTNLLELHSPKIDEPESLLDADPSYHHHFRMCESTDSDCPVRSAANVVSVQGTSSSVWGRIGGSKHRVDMKEKVNSTISSLNFPEKDTKEDQEALANLPGTAQRGNRITTEHIGPKGMEFSPKAQNDTMRSTRKPTQKALRTLFVNGIPQKNNRKEALLSHFRKFGEVIDIYIPSNSERAFVQFSKREEAEAALKAPDAVMGNRFIKLWWANRDSIPDDSLSGGNGVSLLRHGVTSASIPLQVSVANALKDNLQHGPPKASIVHASDSSIPASDQPELTSSSGPKSPPFLQKKLENLELLKGEVRKKQEMLEQKRNDFRRLLDKLEKATGSKSEVAAEHATKRQKVGDAADVVKEAALRSTDTGSANTSVQTEMTEEKSKSVETIVSHSSKISSMPALQEPSRFKQPIRSLAPLGTPFLANRFKLDNRPTAFRIIPPLPAGFANVTTLNEHFLSFGDLSTVVLEDLEGLDGGDSLETSKNISAQVTFTTRRSAEMAFLNGKCWKGHNLQFMWLTSSTANTEHVGRENSPPALKIPSDADIQPVGKSECPVTKEAATTGRGESESSERINSGFEHVEPDEELQTSSTAVSCEKQSPEGNVV